MDISKIEMPSGQTYDIKDASARQDITTINSNLNLKANISDLATLSDVAALEADSIPPLPQQENVVIVFRLYTDLANSEAGSNVTVQVTIGQDNYVYTSGSTGTVQFNVPIGTQYTIVVTPVSGYYIGEGKNTFTATASSLRRNFTIRLMPYQTGLYIVDGSGNEYRFDDWKTEVAAGRKNNTEAKLIKIASAQLCEAGGVFGISIDDLRNRSFESRTWGPTSVFINPPGADYTYNGLLACEILLDYASNNNISLPAVSLAYSKKMEIGGVELQGFLGGSSLWQILWDIRTSIDEILEYTRPEGNNLFSTYTSNKWTSTQDGAYSAYYWTSSLHNNFKDYSCVVVPFFAF